MTARRSLAKGFNEELTCPVCLELFKTPKTLPCLHTFCEECLKGVLKKCIDKPKGAVECPTCRTQHNLPFKGVEGLTTNYTATNLVELLNLHEDDAHSSTYTALPVATVLKCEDGIDDNPAATKCLNCNHYLCEDCTADHKRRRGTRNHKLATLAELRKGGAKQLEQKRYCSDHEGEELKLYCRTCQEVICRDCAIVTHKQHDYTFIKDVREELTKKMKSLLASVGGKKVECQGLLNSIHTANEKEKQKLATQKANVNRFIDDSVQELQLRVAALQSHRATLLTNLAQASAVHTKQLLADEDSLQVSRTRLTSAQTFTQQQLSSASNTDLAMMSNQVIQQLETLRKHKLEKQTAEESQWVVYLPEDNAHTLSSKVLPTTNDALPDAIVVSELGNTSFLGKNTFLVSVSGISTAVYLKPEVKVTSSSGRSCPVKIELSSPQSWSVTYFITCYPQGHEIPMDLRNYAEATSSGPTYGSEVMDVSTSSKCQESDLGILCTTEVHPGYGLVSTSDQASCYTKQETCSSSKKNKKYKEVDHRELPIRRSKTDQSWQAQFAYSDSDMNTTSSTEHVQHTHSRLINHGDQRPGIKSSTEMYSSNDSVSIGYAVVNKSESTGYDSPSTSYDLKSTSYAVGSHSRSTSYPASTSYEAGSLSRSTSYPASTSYEAGANKPMHATLGSSGKKKKKDKHGESIRSWHSYYDSAQPSDNIPTQSQPTQYACEQYAESESHAPSASATDTDAESCAPSAVSPVSEEIDQPTITISVSINGIQAKESPFKLQFNKEMAVGTRVQKKHGRKQGIVKSFRNSYTSVLVQWDGINAWERQYQINELSVCL